jgi:hypothetical protein
VDLGRGRLVVVIAFLAVFAYVFAAVDGIVNSAPVPLDGQPRDSTRVGNRIVSRENGVTGSLLLNRGILAFCRCIIAYLLCGVSHYLQIDVSAVRSLLLLLSSGIVAARWHRFHPSRDDAFHYHLYRHDESQVVKKVVVAWR